MITDTEVPMLFAVLVACAPSWEAYNAELPDAACDQQMACVRDSYESHETCVEALTEAVADEDEPADYDAQSAAECLRLLHEAECTDEALAAQHDACSAVGG